MTWDPWHLVMVRTPEGTTVPARVWLPPLPETAAAGAEPDPPETGAPGGDGSNAEPWTSSAAGRSAGIT